MKKYLFISLLCVSIGGGGAFAASKHHVKPVKDKRVYNVPRPAVPVSVPTNPVPRKPVTIKPAHPATKRQKPGMRNAHHKHNYNHSSSCSHKHKAKNKYTIDRWESGINWHGDLTDEQSLFVIAEQNVLVSAPITTNGVVTLAAGQTIAADVIPNTSNPPGGVDSQMISLPTTAASSLSNVVTLTFGSNPSTAGFAAGQTLMVTGFTGADSYFNGAFTIVSVTATTITYNLPLPHANSTATSNGIVSAALPSGTFYTEELWVCNNPENNILDHFWPVASAVAGGTSLTLRYTPNALATASAYQSSTSPSPVTLKRVRLSVMAYGVAAGMMDNEGNVEIKAKYAINRNKTSSMYLLMAEQQKDGSWEAIQPTTDGENLRFVDSKQVAAWKVSGLKPGHKYTAIVITPNTNLVNHINLGTPVDSQFFLNEVRRSFASAANTVFTMPYPEDDCRDIRIIAGSCSLDGAEELFKMAAARDYDFSLHLGDHVYADFSGSSLLNFNLPNNAGAALGFANLGAYNIYPTITGTNAIAANTVINATNNIFVMDGVRYAIPQTTYVTPASLAAAVALLVGSDFNVSVNGSNQLVITRPFWSNYGYSETYTGMTRGVNYTKFQASGGSYNTSDDHEVFNNYQSITTVPIYLQGTATEVAISTAMNTNVTAAFYRVNYAPLQLAPAPAVPIANVNIDTALGEFDRYIPNRFVTTNERFGYVRWGEVELIQLDSVPYRNNLGQYEYYQEQGRFMRDDQLEFLRNRLSVSDAKVKIVMYSRHIASTFFSLEEIEEQKAVYVSIAVGLGYNATDAATTFDKVFRAFETAFIQGYLPWYTETFLPTLEATGAKNVYFVTGGNHYATLAHLVTGSPFIEIGTSSWGTPSFGSNSDGMKNGEPNAHHLMEAYSKENGFTEIVVSPKNETVTVSFVTRDGDQNAVTFPIH